MKRFISIIIICFMSAALFACGKDKTENLIESGKNAMDSKQYEAALESFKQAIDEGTTDEEAKKLYDIVKAYIDAEALFEEKSYAEAAKILNKINVEYKLYSIKDDITFLIDKNKKELDYSNENDEKLKAIEDFISSGNFIDADTIVSELEKRQLSESQMQKFSELKEKVKQNISDEEKSENDIENNTQENVSDNNQSSNNTYNGNDSDKLSDGGANRPVANAEEAVELAKNFISADNGYMPSVVKVDHEENGQYVVQAYDVIDNGDNTSHNATVGWYYVNKETGEVKSMF